MRIDEVDTSYGNMSSDITLRSGMPERWDTGPGEHGDFPSKWMSEDGRTLYLVFSGDDHFCVRKATLKLRRPAADARRAPATGPLPGGSSGI